MIDNERITQWDTEARTQLMRYLSKNEEIARLASIVLSLISERDERERYIQEKQ